MKSFGSLSKKSVYVVSACFNLLYDIMSSEVYYSWQKAMKIKRIKDLKHVTRKLESTTYFLKMTFATKKLTSLKIRLKTFIHLTLVWKLLPLSIVKEDIVFALTHDSYPTLSCHNACLLYNYACIRQQYSKVDWVAARIILT